MLHINQLRAILRAHQPFDCKVWKANGEIAVYTNVVAISTYFKNGTANLKFLNSGQIRKVPVLFIFEVNDEEIYI